MNEGLPPGGRCLRVGHSPSMAGRYCCAQPRILNSRPPMSASQNWKSTDSAQNSRHAQARKELRGGAERREGDAYC